MFDQLAKDVASRLGIPATSVTTLVAALLALMTSERSGGINGFSDLFRAAGLGDVFTSWFGGREAKPITAQNLETVFGTSTLDTLAHGSSLTRTMTTSALALLLPRVIAALTPKGELPANSALATQMASDAGGAPTVQTRAVTEKTRIGRWIPWATAALLALAAFLWMRGPSGSIEPQLTLSNRNGTITYSGVVRDESTRAAVITALQSTYGAPNVSGELKVNRDVKRAPWLSHIRDLTDIAKNPGVELTVDGSAVNLGGWLSARERDALSARIRDVFGASTVIGSLGDASANAARSANDQAVSDLVALGTSGVLPDSLVQVMNRSVINFPTGSAQVPTDSMEVIRRSADALKNSPAGTTIEIGGHTDSFGDPTANIVLSQERADAVRHALIAAGAPAGILTTRGYGESRPRASNDSEYGRFQNRRIEYKVIRQ